MVACTLAAAGGELASLLGNALHFDGLIIDEVRPCIVMSWSVLSLHPPQPHCVSSPARFTLYYISYRFGM